jgi:TP901 family phage tail tape measure protein
MPGLYFNSGIDRGFQKDLKEMNKDLFRFSRNVQKQGKVVDNTFKQVTRTVGGLVSVMAIGAAGKELITFSRDLETALTEVSTISQAVTDDFEGYKDAILELSTQSATSAKSLTDAFYDIVSAGYDGQRGLELLTAAERASTAGFVEVGTAADGLTTVLNAWGKEASEATSVSDIFFKTVEKGKTTFPELGQNIAQVAPIAASLGVSFEEVSAAAATLTKSGTPTAQAFTQIRASLLATNEVLGDGWAETMTYQEALAEVRKQAGGSTNELKEMLGRVEAVNAVLGLTGKNAQTASEDLNAMNNSLGATATAADKVVASTDQQIKILKNNILAALEPLSEQASTTIANLAKGLNDAFKSGDVQKYAKVLVQLTKAFVAYKVSVIALNQVQKLRKNILLNNIKAMRLSAQTGKKVTAGNLLMARSFKAVSAAFKANPIGLVVTALTLALPVIKTTVKAFETAGSKMKKINKEIEKAFAEESSGLKILQDQLNDSNISYERKQELIKQINSEYGQYLPALLEEDASLEEINAALAIANDRLKEQIKLKVLNQKATETATKIYELENKLRDAGDNKLLQGADIISAALQARVGILAKNLENEKEAYERILDEIVAIGKEKSEEITIEEEPVKKEVKKKVYTSDKQLEKQREDSLEKLEIAYQNETNALIKKYEGDEKLQKEFQNDILKADLKYLKAKKKLTIGELNKIGIEREIINKEIEQKILNQSEDSTDEELKQLDIQHQKKVNELIKQYGNEQDQQDIFHKEMLKADLEYLRAKSKLTKDEFEKLRIEYQILTKEINQDSTSAKDSSATDTLKVLGDTFASTGDSLTNQLAELSTNMVGAFETLNSETSTSADKVTGIISLIIAAGNIIKDFVANTYTEEASEQSAINKELSNRINAETTINQILLERRRIELESSAFLTANYKERYALATQSLKDSQKALDSTLSGLASGLTLTAEGQGESWLGINKTAEEYSFTLDEIINKTDTLSGVETGAIISNILDPADFFGGAASGDAYQDALNQVSSAFNSTLKEMGKTAADMATFSQEEWVEFYTVLDEGGYIVDEGTKKLVNGMKEAQEEYLAAMEEMKNIISEVAGSLGDSLSDSIVNAVANGTDALDEFESSLNKVFVEMAKAEMNQLFFQSMFDQLQADMEASMAGGDQDWQDDLLRFYDQLPSAIENSEQFLKDFDAQLQALGFEGITGGGSEAGDTSLSTAGQIRQNITEETGTILAGHIGAMRLSNERIANISEDMLDLGVQNLVTLNKIKENTDYLPAIAENTRKTVQKLGGS